MKNEWMNESLQWWCFFLITTTLSFPHSSSKEKEKGRSTELHGFTDLLRKKKGLIFIFPKSLLTRVTFNFEIEINLTLMIVESVLLWWWDGELMAKKKKMRRRASSIVIINWSHNNKSSLLVLYYLIIRNTVKHIFLYSVAKTNWIHPSTYPHRHAWKKNDIWKREQLNRYTILISSFFVVIWIHRRTRRRICQSHCRDLHVGNNSIRLFLCNLDVQIEPQTFIQEGKEMKYSLTYSLFAIYR